MLYHSHVVKTRFLQVCDYKRKKNEGTVANLRLNENYNKLYQSKKIRTILAPYYS